MKKKDFWEKEQDQLIISKKGLLNKRAGPINHKKKFIKKSLVLDTRPEHWAGPVHKISKQARTKI